MDSVTAERVASRKERWISILATGVSFSGYAVIDVLAEQRGVEPPLSVVLAVSLLMLIAPGMVLVACAAADVERPDLPTLALLSVNGIGTFVAVLLLVGAGLLLFVVPGFVAAIVFLYAVPIAALEGAGPVAALTASASFATDRFWHATLVLGVLLATLAFATIAGGAAAVALRNSGAPELVGVAVAASVPGFASATWVHWLAGQYADRTLHANDGDTELAGD